MVADAPADWEEALAGSRPFRPGPLDRAVAKSRVVRALFPLLRRPAVSFRDRYRISGVLGRGSFGIVVEAHDTRLDRGVAIKLLPRTEAADRGRVLREARALAAVEHPAVVGIFDFGEFRPGELPQSEDWSSVLDGCDGAFIVLELIQGETLSEWCHRRPRTSREIVSAFVSAGRGLAAAHRRGVIHRDFKPGNVMIDRRGRTRVVDFGLACGVRRGEGTDPSEYVPTAPDRDVIQGGPQSLSTLSQPGECWGTPAYMSPEQMLGGPIDERSDQFSFCVALWEALAGYRPFVDRPGSDRYASIEEGLRDASIPEVQPAIITVLRRGLRLDPARRFVSMDALIGALVRAQAPRRSLRLIGAAVPLLVVAGLWTGDGVAERTDTARQAPAVEASAVDSDTLRRAASILASAEELRKAGDDLRALELYERALGDGDALGTTTVGVELRIGAARALALLGRYDDARVHLEEAWGTAIASGDDRLAAVAGTQLIFVTGLV